MDYRLILILSLFLSACSSAPLEPGEDTQQATEASLDTATDEGEWIQIFDGAILDGWVATAKMDAFSVQDGALYCDGSGGGILYYEPQQFQDFVLETEVKVTEGANSGIFFRMSDPSDPVQTGIEIQVLDSYGKEELSTHDFGAVYDISAPTANPSLPPGEWNQVRLTAEETRITVEINGQVVNDIDLSEWTEAGRNPDGTPNKFNTAYREMTQSGYIGFQDHGNPVWYRNVRVKLLQ
ncbi:MAG TPA: DUF1080 domain-containing protein [Acidobacteriota bacterium]|nr:DUF1080 domain-containing protein [Acidobacteriota bacterium]